PSRPSTRGHSRGRDHKTSTGVLAARAVAPISRRPELSRIHGFPHPEVAICPPLAAAAVTDLAATLHQAQPVRPFGAQLASDVLALLLDANRGARGTSPPSVRRQAEHVALNGKPTLAKVRARGLEHQVGAGRGRLPEGRGA